jgi:hypothetical protein
VVLVTDEKAFEGEQSDDAASTSKRLQLRRSERPSWPGAGAVCGPCGAAVTVVRTATCKDLGRRG